MKLEYCCPGFQALVENMGEAGISAVLKETEELTYFCLQSRTCAAVDVERISMMIPQNAGSIRIVEQTGLRYCPFCGANLQEWLAGNAKTTRYLVDKSRNLILN